MRGIILKTLLALAAPLPALSAQAAWPERPIKIISAQPAGGPSAIIAALLADKLKESLGQTVIMQPLPGADGGIGAAFVAHAQPDGYTLLVGYTGNIAINPSLYKTLPYNPLTELDPVSLVASSPFLLVVYPALPAHTLPELLALAKSSRNPLNYGSTGIGSLQQLGMEWLKSLTGVNMVHVPYQGAQVYTAVMGNEVQAAFVSVVGMLPFVKSGKATAIAVTSTTRSPVLPEVPTMIESGIPGFELTNWFGIMAPHNTPKPVVDRLSQLIASYMHDPAIRQKLTGLGADPVGSTPEAFAALIRTETARWAQVVKTAGVAPQ